MTRVRSFAAPHKGLRSILGKFARYLGQTDVTDALHLGRLKQLGQELFTLLKDHVHTENEHTLKRLDERAPGITAQDRHDHDRLEWIQQALEDQLAGLTGTESYDTMHAFYLAFSQFQSQYLEHIYEEETVTEVLLQQHFTDEELLQQRSSVLQGFELSRLLLWLKYIIPAQREDENLAMLAGLKAHAPQAVVEQVLTTIQQELDDERFHRLSKRLFSY